MPLFAALAASLAGSRRANIQGRGIRALRWAAGAIGSLQQPCDVGRMVAQQGRCVPASPRRRMPVRSAVTAARSPRTPGPPNRGGTGQGAGSGREVLTAPAGRQGGRRVG